jgi:dihydrofolate reductase/thymidylate synthase
MEVIIAFTNDGGIGYNNTIPWKCKEDLKIFKEKTLNNVILVGRKTYESLPILKERIILVVSKNINYITNYKDNVYFFGGDNSIDNAINFYNINYNNKKLFIAGGADIYNYILKSEKLYNKIKLLHISLINIENIKCDVFIDKKLFFNNSIIKNKITYYKNNLNDHDFEHYELIPLQKNKGEYQYLNLIEDIISINNSRYTRNGKTLSIFCPKPLIFDLRNGFPLMTTKKTYLYAIIEELLFFLKGETDSKILENKGIKIWSGNTSRQFLDNLGKQYRDEGKMGPMYGYQWRYYGSEYDEKTGKPLIKDGNKYIDQLKDVIDLINNDPTSRRILMTDYNPLQAKEGVLYPCHSIILQFYVDNEYLDLFCYNRSQDVALGVPFNIASTSLLLIIISKITKKIPRYFNLSIGDAHIYEEHIQPLKEQLNRIPYIFPTININKQLDTIEDINNLVFNDFELLNYKSHPIIKMKMIV